MARFHHSVFHQGSEQRGREMIAHASSSVSAAELILPPVAGLADSVTSMLEPGVEPKLERLQAPRLCRARQTVSCKPPVPAGRQIPEDE